MAGCASRRGDAQHVLVRGFSRWDPATGRCMGDGFLCLKVRPGAYWGLFRPWPSSGRVGLADRTMPPSRFEGPGPGRNRLPGDGAGNGCSGGPLENAGCSVSPAFVERDNRQDEPAHMFDNNSVPCRQWELTDRRPKFPVDENPPFRFLPGSDFAYFPQHTRGPANGLFLSVFDEPDRR